MPDNFVIISEALFAFIRETIEVELVEELRFLVNYDKTKRAIQEVVDMPDRLIDLFIRCCFQNRGKLSKRKHEELSKMLSDQEVAGMEDAIRQALETDPRGKDSLPGVNVHFHLRKVADTSLTARRLRYPPGILTKDDQMTRSIFDPTGTETEHSGNVFTGPAADNDSQMPSDIVDGKVSAEEVAEQEQEAASQEDPVPNAIPTPDAALGVQVDETRKNVPPL